MTLSLVSRFLAGAFSGIIWGMPRRLRRASARPPSAGLSLAIVSIGAPARIRFRHPPGAWIGTTFDWRWSFGGLPSSRSSSWPDHRMRPDAPGQPARRGFPWRGCSASPAVAVILAVIVAWMLAHSTIYTYIAPYLRTTETDLTADFILLIYGVASVIGVAITGALLDRHPRPLLHLSVAAFIAAGVVLLIGHLVPGHRDRRRRSGASPSAAPPPNYRAALTTAGGETPTSPTRSSRSPSTWQSSAPASSAHSSLRHSTDWRYRSS